MALEFLRRTRTPIALTLSLLALFFLIPLTVSESCAEDVQLPQREWERRTHTEGDPDIPDCFTLEGDHTSLFDGAAVLHLKNTVYVVLMVISV